jgi:PAS domain S-box-containing protein
VGDPETESPRPAAPPHSPPTRSDRAAPASVGEVVFEQASDAIIVTGPDVHVEAWNPAAERLYGISAAEAVGHHLDELLRGRAEDGTNLDDEFRKELGRVGSWHRRIVQRPLVGSRRGAEIIVDAVITSRDPSSTTFSGGISLNRDVTVTARLESQLVTLGSLAAETGRGRSAQEIAASALEVLCRATAADGGLILSVEGGYEVTGSRGISEALVERIASTGRIGERLGRALERVDAAVAVDVPSAPVSDSLREALQADGLATVAFAGMRVRGRLTGLLGLGWRGEAPTGPSGPVLVQAAALVASALENARLLERVELGLALERRLTERLQTLVELTRLPDAADKATIARYLLDRISILLGATGGTVVEIADGQLRSLASIGDLAGLERLRERQRAATEWMFVRAFEAGRPSFVESIDQGEVSAESVAIAEAEGFRSFAAIPIRDDGRLDSVLIALFAEPASELPIDERMLEAIGRVVDISFANQRLRQVASASEERYRALFERSPDALLVQATDDHVVDANPAALEMFGADLAGRHVAELAAIDTDELQAQRQTALQRGEATWTGTGRRLDGSAFPAEFERTRIRIAGEDRLLVLVRDTTERDRLQQELLQAQKMEAIGLLVAGVAHELNNPLASIVAFSQLIRTDPDLPADLRHHADLLIAESNRTRRIVQNLLDFARQRSPERTPTSVRELVEGVLALQSYTFGPSRIEAVIDIPDDLPAVPLDRAQIQQVFVNLTLNAAQAIRSRAERGTIRIVAVAVARDDGPRMVRVSVTDDGPGIPEDLRSRLFVPFFTTKAPGEGTGLGLSVSFGIVVGHGGTLRHEPGPNGMGATFIVELPVDQDQPAGEPPAARAASPATRSEPVASAEPTGRGRAAPPSTPRVLVLDDEASIRDFLARILSRAGYEPVVAADGLTALEVVRSDPPDAILCDHRMAGMTGTAFHEAVAELHPELARRFVFMSGDVLNPELRDFAVERGIVLLAKPFDIDTVGRTVARILEA